jgi:hypothetical protein
MRAAAESAVIVVFTFRSSLLDHEPPERVRTLIPNPKAASPIPLVITRT